MASPCCRVLAIALCRWADLYRYHQGVSTRRKIVVDGETFTVKRRGRGNYEYEWISGPNPGYGFASASHPRIELDEEGHRWSLREFLAEIDPVTGYLREE